MSFHSTLIAGVGSPLLLELAGQSLSVQIKGEGAARTLTALVGKERTVERQVGNVRKLFRERRVAFTNDESSRFGGIENLQMNATATYAGVDYAIHEMPSEQDGMVSAVLRNSAVEEYAGRDYRG